MTDATAWEKQTADLCRRVIEELVRALADEVEGADNEYSEEEKP